jgi:translation initiation factor 1 (eIF-1/SUI1)
MNPFENEENNTNTFLNEVIITTEKAEKRDKKTLTKIYGLEFDSETMKKHFSALKKSLGCNGSLKDDDNGKPVISLQGETHCERIEAYLTKIGVKNIKINMS